MKSFKGLMESLLEAWPGTPEYEKKFGKARGLGAGSRHEIETKDGVTRATRKYNADTGMSDEPTTSAASATEPAVKRGRGRPPGKYGSYKKKVKESLEIIESLETDEEIAEFIQSLDEESFNELQDYLDEVTEEVEQIDELSKKTLGSYIKHASDDRAWRAGSAAASREQGKDKSSERHHALSWKRAFGIYKATDRLTKEDVQVEAVDTPGNSYKHQCALHVRHAKLGEGKCVFAEHAEPDAQGNIEWYTVDFGNGLVEKIMTENLEILVSESHNNHKKEEVEQTEENIKHPNQKVLDKNKNNKLDKEDFAILRGEKKANESKINESLSVDALAAFISKQAKGE